MKTIYITEAQKKKIKKAIAAQDQVGGKVNAGVMDAVAHGGGMCESSENGSLDIWYRGYDSKYPNLGVPKNHGMWMTDNIEYAKTYAEEFGKYGKIAKITIDWSKISWATEGEIYDLELDVYDSDEDTCRIVKQNGYNAWICDYYSDGARGLCLIDSSPIVSIEDVDESEYSNYVEENVEKDTYELGAEKGMSPYYHVNESLDELDLYHGTNADFDKFDEKFYLTGIGEMAYGWGVYLSNSINTAKEYGPGGQIMTVEVPDGKYLDSRRISKS